MLSSSNPVPKLYLSIIEDVIESLRELFQDEGVEERVLDDLRQMWESKVMQSKAVEGFLKDTLNPSNFVLQLPANYAQTLQKPAASVVAPASQSVPSFTTKANSTASLATFTLPPGVTYPVQIPAGVTLQTSSGHLYKVNVPVMVTQAPGVNRIFTQPLHHMMDPQEPAAPQRAVPSTALQAPPPQVTDRCASTATTGPPLRPPDTLQQQQQNVVLNQRVGPTPSTTTQPLPPTAAQPLPPRANQALRPTANQPLLPPVNQPLRPTANQAHHPKANQPLLPPVNRPLLPPVNQPLLPPVNRPLPPSAALPPMVAQILPPPPESPGDDQFTLEGIEFSPRLMDSGLATPLSIQLSDFQAGQTPASLSDILGVGAEEVLKADSGAGAEHGRREGPVELEVGLPLDYNNNNTLEEMVQLDGACGGSSSEEDVQDDAVDEEEGEAMAENEFLGIINAEALRALQEGEESIAGGSSDSSDDANDLADEEEEDPLNSGDDVSEQDVPDLFDTDNVVVCQYDKIHRSKNRWKFYLKDGVMCFSGKDYVFSKAVGEAEW